MKRKGFTLLELVFSIIISAIILYPICSVIFNLASKNPTVENAQMSVRLASSKMEEVSNRMFTNISTQATTPFGGKFPDFSYSVEVHYVNAGALETSVDPTVTSYKLIIVKVNGVELRTIVSDISNAQ